MIYTPSQLIPIIPTLSSNFEATISTCDKLTDAKEECDNCYFDFGKHCGATFHNPDWQASLDQLKLTNPEFFV